MKKTWTAGLNKDDAAIMKREFLGAALARARLTELLDKDIQAKAKKGRSEDLYSSPNWGIQQADINGYTRALEHVISLIE